MKPFPFVMVCSAILTATGAVLSAAVAGSTVFEQRVHTLTPEEQSERYYRLPIEDRIALQYIVHPPAQPIASALREEARIRGDMLQEVLGRWQAFHDLKLEEFDPTTDWFWQQVNHAPKATVRVLASEEEEPAAIAPADDPAATTHPLIVHVPTVTTVDRKSALGAPRLVARNTDAKSQPSTKAETGSAADTTSGDDGTTKPNPPPPGPLRPPSYIFTHGGLRMLSPFNIRTYIDPKTGKPQVDAKGEPTGQLQLSSDSTNVGGFFELVFGYVWAWDPVRQERTRRKYDGGDPVFQYVFAGLFDGRGNDGARSSRLNEFFSNVWDITGRVSFEFGKDESASASAITGSGDFNAEVTLDRHLMRGYSLQQQMAFSANLTLSVSGFTDRKTSKVHPRLFYGPSLSMSFDDPFSQTRRNVWFRMQGGYARIHRLFFLPPDPSNPDGKGPPSQLIETRGGLPVFRERAALAFETEVFWPLRQTALLSLGARLYGKTNPAPWTLYLGITVPIVGVADTLGPK